MCKRHTDRASLDDLPHMLEHLGNMLRRSIHATGFVARSGSEALVVMLSNVDAGAGHVLAKARLTHCENAACSAVVPSSTLEAARRPRLGLSLRLALRCTPNARHDGRRNASCEPERGDNDHLVRGADRNSLDVTRHRDGQHARAAHRRALYDDAPRLVHFGVPFALRGTTTTIMWEHGNRIRTSASRRGSDRRVSAGTSPAAWYFAAQCSSRGGRASPLSKGCCMVLRYVDDSSASEASS